ncbi:MAG: phosphoribosylamine--glycine ligase [Saprospiraceae bacterium]|nr:phosphoribosylamine--glycine ligase [Saprospiraceae bacterium]
MNILILGSGGREHALAWKVAQSPVLDQLFIAPGNAGTKQHGTNIAIDITDARAVGDCIEDRTIELVIIGPEVPLVRGIVDELETRFPKLCIIGPHASGAQLEGSKAFSKEFMQRHNIPTASYQSFSLDQLQPGIEFIRAQSLPIVLKADGLAAGKGVLICSDHDTAIEEFEAMLNGKFGRASAQVVIESFLSGIEFSVFVLTDGRSYKLLPIAKDYKRIGEGDTGLNTGGMGSVSPVPFVDESLLAKVRERIIEPTIQGIQADGLKYRGFIFFGLINVDGDPMVIEYNCRMGDPETQSVLPRLRSDLVALCMATCQGTLPAQSIEIDERVAATIVLASGGYPGSYEKGKAIAKAEDHSQGMLFHAGTKMVDGELQTSGGRVLAVTSFGSDLESALIASRQKAAEISFEGKTFRADIGFDL